MIRKFLVILFIWVSSAYSGELYSTGRPLGYYTSNPPYPKVIIRQRYQPYIPYGYVPYSRLPYGYRYFWKY